MTLWNNVTARNIGDTLTIRLAESTEAEKSPTTTASKSSTATSPDPTVAGRPVTANGVPVLEGAWTTSSTSPATVRQPEQQARRLHHRHRLQASVQRQPAGARPEVGRHQFRPEFVRLQGIVRPSDIAPDNSVLSWQVADAYISYGGQGTVANASKPGWLYRFFNSPKTPF